MKAPTQLLSVHAFIIFKYSLVESPVSLLSVAKNSIDLSYIDPIL